jgi:hypothetical protein
MSTQRKKNRFLNAKRAMGAKLKVGDEALFEPEFPFFEATLEETQRRVWVCSVRYIIIGIQGDTFTAECLIGQPVVWAYENVVRLGR